MKEFVDFYNQVVSWNKRAGVKEHTFGTLDWDRAVELQTKLLVEESTEAYDSSKVNDYVGLLDGCIDNLVIAFKFAEMLESAGFNVKGAFEAVIANNETKLYPSYYQAVEQKEKLEERDDVEYTIETATENGVSWYSIRRQDGKITKGVDFKPVSLEQFVPKESY